MIVDNHLGINITKETSTQGFKRFSHPVKPYSVFSCEVGVIGGTMKGRVVKLVRHSRGSSAKSALVAIKNDIDHYRRMGWVA